MQKFYCYTIPVLFAALLATLSHPIKSLLSGDEYCRENQTNQPRLLSTPYNESYVLATYTVKPKGHDCSEFFGELFVCVESVDDVRIESAVEIENDSIVSYVGCQRNAPWNLDYISHRDRVSTRGEYPYDDPLPPTKVYVLDTDVEVSHPEFEGRARIGKQILTGTNGHGTHVAGIIAGKRYGVNKNARIISVQVLDGSGRGAWSAIIKGLEWVAEQEKGIVNMSIGGGYSPTVNRVVELMASKGWQLVIAAGNESQDACNTSPASANGVVTAAAANSEDRLAGFSNFGKCVDVVAPGVDILSAYTGKQYAYMSGTSMAAPHLAGLWSLQPWLSTSEFIAKSSSGIIKGQRYGTPDRYSLWLPVCATC